MGQREELDQNLRTWLELDPGAEKYVHFDRGMDHELRALSRKRANRQAIVPDAEELVCVQRVLRRLQQLDDRYRCALW